jgi:hypothetical protein
MGLLILPWNCQLSTREFEPVLQTQEFYPELLVFTLCADKTQVPHLKGVSLMPVKKY